MRLLARYSVLVVFVGLSSHAQTYPERLPGIQRVEVFDATRFAVGTLREPGAVRAGDLEIASALTQPVLLGETSAETWFAGYWTYVTLKAPMPEGATMVVDAGTGGTRELVYDVDETVSAAVKVNQLGYLPRMPKYAYLGTQIPGIGALRWVNPTFDLVHAATRKIVFSGPAVLRADVQKNAKGESLSGEAVYAMDFTSVDASGRYYIRIPGVGRSYEFRIGDDAWTPLYYHVARFLFHQRNGQPLDQPYTAFTRASNGARPVYRGQALPKVLGFPATIAVTSFDLNAWSIAHPMEPPLIEKWNYGWRNAADEDDVATLHISNVFDILWNFERHPERYFDGQLNLPESTNDIPDILDEALYFLEGYRALQAAIGTGEVPGWINNHRHRFNENSDIPWITAAPDRAATLVFAAGFAQMAATLQRVEHPLASAYAAAAKSAYSWGIDEAHNVNPHTLHAIKDRGRGEEFTFEFTQAMADARNRNVGPHLVMAKTALHALTGDARYLEDIDELVAVLRRPGFHPFVMKDYSPHLYWDLVHLPSYAGLRRAFYLDEGDRLIKSGAATDYRFSKSIDDRALRFGNSKTTGQARFLIFCFELTRDEKYLRAAIPNVDFVLGANPLGLSWITYVGHAWPQRIQCGTVPFPGISVYGPWESFGKDFTGKPMAKLGIPLDRPLYKRWAPHQRTLTSGNEYELNDSSALFCGLYFVPEHWRPCPDLAEMTPVAPWQNPGEFPLQ